MNMERDILRCNPNFHKKERFNTALIQVEAKTNKAIFVRLLFIFTVWVEGKIFYLALVLSMDNAPSSTNRVRDQHLRITRVQPQARSGVALINADKIIRGGLLPKDGGSKSGEFLVNKFVDQDMWVRMQPEHTKLITRSGI